MALCRQRNNTCARRSRLLTLSLCTCFSAAHCFADSGANETAKQTLTDALPPQKLIVSYKRPELDGQGLVLFEADMLQMALALTEDDYGPYEMRAIPPMNRARTLAAITQDIYPNLILMLSYEDDLAERNQLSYIPISLDRGVMSYRICFMRDQLKDETHELSTPEDLQNYNFGSGIGWADAKVLRSNGLHVTEADSVVSLFRMTKAGRIDFFCRGISEYQTEYIQQKNTTNLTTDKHLTLYYPLPKFFFANRNSQYALDRVNEGLKRSIETGGFMNVWKKYYGVNVKLVDLEKRTIIQLNNPLVTHLPKEYQEDALIYRPRSQAPAP